jgi:DNA-binding transcriptional regulator YiaG
LIDLLTPADLAKQLQVPIATLEKWRSRATNNTGPAFIKIGRHIRYDPADVEAWLVTNKT